MDKVQPTYKSISTITGYKTTDGRIFQNINTAQEWQEYLEYKSQLYCIFNNIFDDFLDEHSMNEFPFDYRDLREILEFMVANLDLKDLINKLTEVRDAK